MITNNDRKALKKFGQHLNKLRMQKKLSLRKMEANCDIDNSKIAKIEKGRVNVTVATLIELAKGLEIHPKELLDYNFD